MPKRNRYSGILQPRLVGRGLVETPLLVLYDVEEDCIRSRISSTCLDYGLERIQFSAFAGKLDRNRREELCLRIQSEVGAHQARIRVIPLSVADLKTMWIFDQYCLPKETAASGGPKLRVISLD